MGKNKFLDDLLKDCAAYFPSMLKGGEPNINVLKSIAIAVADKYQQDLTQKENENNVTPAVINPIDNPAVNTPSQPNAPVNKCVPFIIQANKLSSMFKTVFSSCSSLIKLANDLSDKLRNRNNTPTINTPIVTVSTDKCTDGKGTLILGTDKKKDAFYLCIESDDNGHVVNPSNNNNLTNDDIEIFKKKSSET